jgi:hypothetical protein
MFNDVCGHEAQFNIFWQISLLGKLEVQDDNGKDLICFVWPIQIVE